MDDIGNATERVEECHAEYLPSLAEYYGSGAPAVIAASCGGAVAVVLTCLLYAGTLRDVLSRKGSDVKASTAIVTSIYPVSSFIVYLSVVIPRAQFLIEVVLQGSFVVCLYQFFCLLVAYCGGEAQLAAMMRPAALQPVTGPCCCCPCCRLCCRPLDVSKRNLNRVRVLVLQLPVVQWFFYLVLFVLRAEDLALYQAVYLFVQPVLVASMMFAIWGTNMMLELLGPSLELQGHRAKAKFIALQVVVISNVILSTISKLVAGALPCTFPLSPSLYCSLAVDMAVLVVSIACAAWSRSLYCKQPAVQLTSTYSVDTS